VVRKRKKEFGRKTGGRNKGYWYRKGRGWCVSQGASKIPLLDQAGNLIKAPDTPDNTLKDAYARYLLGLQEKAKQEATGDKALVLNVIVAYLDYCQANNRPSTYNKRGEFLFDFCFGLPSRFWDRGGSRKCPKPKKTDYIHKGYGTKEVGQLIPLDVQQWLNKHTWGKGTIRMALQSLRRALNYAKEMGLIKTNPVKGFKIPTAGKRITFFTPEQEQAMYANTSKALALVIKVCIRTGVRYGSEFTTLTAKHVESTPRGMVWKFSADESKTHKPRVIYVPAEIAEIVRPLMKRHLNGALFRNRKGQPWTIENLRSAFGRLKRKLAKKGIQLDDDACLYSCRHTFAKRTLGGYWTGKPTTIEQVAAAMGNSRQVCWEHYAKWCDNYTDPIWDAVDGGR
jgi:integrase